MRTIVRNRTPRSNEIIALLRLAAGTWLRLAVLLRTSPSGLVALAIVTGADAGLGAIAFRYLILW
jgi:hypothetical protein